MKGTTRPGFRTAAKERYLKKHVEQEHASGKKDFGQWLREEFGQVKGSEVKRTNIKKVI